MKKEVTIGSKIRLKLGGDLKIVQVVGSGDVDIKNGKISYLSPVGESLLGRKIGERFEIIINENKKIQGQVLAID